MRKEKLSYIVLLAEVAVIIYLHSIKSPVTSEPVEEKVVASTPVKPKIAVGIHQAVFHSR